MLSENQVSPAERVRAEGKKLGPPRLRDASLPHLNFNTTSCKLSHKSTIRSILLKLKMDNPLWSSPPRDSENGPWKTPSRKTVRILARQGKSDREIFTETGIPRSTIQRIRQQETSRRMHRTRPNYPRIITAREIRRALCFIATSYTIQCLIFECIRSIPGITASVRTIRQELRKLGYRCYISCPRPFISRIQAKKRLSFVRIYR